MIALTPKKAVSNLVIIPAPKGRGVMPPPTKIRPGKRKDDVRGNARSIRWM